MINALFRKRNIDDDSDEADRLRRRKDELIDEMASLCGHPSVIATRGSRSHGPHRGWFSARRICERCGWCESLFCQREFRQLAGKPTAFFDPDDYLIREGLILKKLGINI